MIKNIFSKTVQTLNWKNSILFLLSAIVVFRLIVWKFIPRAEIFIKEDGCNLLIASVILFLAFIVAIVKFFRRQLWPQTGFEYPFIVLLFSCFLSLFFTVDLSITIRVIIPFIGCVAFFYLLMDVLDTHPRRWFFLWVMLACAFVTSLFALWDLRMLEGVTPDIIQRAQRGDLRYILQTKRATSFIGWPNSLAGYLLLTWPLIMGGAFFFKKHLKWIFVGMGIVVSLGLLATFSFLGWSSLLLSFLVMMPFLFSVVLKKVSLKGRAILGIIIFLMGIGFGIVVIKKNFASAIAPRIIYYDHSKKLIQQKPLQGHGLGTYGVVSRPFVENGDGITNYPHNTYLQWWIEGGILGFVGIIWFVGVFGVVFLRILRRQAQENANHIPWLLGWGLLAFFIDNFFSFTFFKPNIALHGWAILAIFMSWSKELHLIDMASQEGKSETTRLMYLKNVVWRLLMIVFLGGACIFSSRLTIGSFWYWKGFEGMKRNQAVMAAEAFQKGAFYDRWSSAYPVAAGNLAIAIFRSSKKEYYLRQAEQHYLEATRREPYLYVHYFILSDIYQRLADFEKQKYYDQKAKELSPFEYRQSVAKRNQTR